MSCSITTTRPWYFVWNDERTENMRKAYGRSLDPNEDEDAWLMNDWRAGLILTVPKGSVLQKNENWDKWYPNQCLDPREGKKQRIMQSVEHFNGNWIGPYDEQLLKAPGDLFAITSISENHYALRSLNRPHQEQKAGEFLRGAKLLELAQKFPHAWPAFLGYDLLWQEGNEWKIFPRCALES